MAKRPTVEEGEKLRRELEKAKEKNEEIARCYNDLDEIKQDLEEELERSESIRRENLREMGAFVKELSRLAKVEEENQLLKAQVKILKEVITENICK